MLIRITDEQIVAFWDVIKYAVENSAPTHVKMGPEQTNNLLDDLLCETADCWVSYVREDKNKINGIVITKVVLDDATKTRNLLVYSVFAYDLTDKNTWVEGAQVLARWGKSKKCHKIIGFTTEDKIVKIINKLGGDTSTRLIMLDIDKLL